MPIGPTVWKNAKKNTINCVKYIICLAEGARLIKYESDSSCSSHAFILKWWNTVFDLLRCGMKFLSMMLPFRIPVYITWMAAPSK